jgi:hypothetical protein
MSIIQKLSEGIVNRDMKTEGEALLKKWTQTGLLEGLQNDQSKQNMARLLENQAKELLREASSMAGGDVEGFAAVAFPIVRRVFAGLIANDLVSVQPMSLPSGLIFFLDFTYTNTRSGLDAGESVYGGGVVAKGIIDGVSDITEAGGGMYNIANYGYSSPTGSTGALTEAADADPADTVAGEINDTASLFGGTAGVAISALTAAQKKALRFDPDILATVDTTKRIYSAQVFLSAADALEVNFEALGAVQLMTGVDTTVQCTMGLTGGSMIRRLTERGYRNSSGELVKVGNSAHVAGEDYITLYYIATSGTFEVDGTNAAVLRYPLKDDLAAGGALGSVVGQHQWGLEGAGNNNAAFDGASKDVIPEIDIKVDSTAITAITKKLKAKWTPELGQDLNAYHNLDAEVELTSILSEQIALEIDREILNDLIKGATAGNFYWSRAPGLFVDKTTGTELGASSAAPDFTGTVSEWYETLIETINDVSAQIHRKTLRGGANFVVTSPEVANILEFTSGFRANVTADADRGDIGAVKVGSLSRKFDVIVDPYFPRNLVLVGRRGNSFLESGFVYAPYVPLQTTPTIFGTEDFVPRKGVMTRYGKKMVRPDMYGLVIVRGLLGEAGATS